ncbi:Mucin-associated surface protein (MASP), subgroup S050, partial [Trypanosoma cruzi]
MAMTMTGRVLLVCALCVLWCGAGGCAENDVVVAGSLEDLGIGRDDEISKGLSSGPKLQEGQDQRAAASGGGGGGGGSTDSRGVKDASLPDKGKNIPQKQEVNLGSHPNLPTGDEYERNDLTEVGVDTRNQTAPTSTAQSPPGLPPPPPPPPPPSPEKAAEEDEDSSIEQHPGEDQQLLQEEVTEQGTNTQNQLIQEQHDSKQLQVQPETDEEQKRLEEQRQHQDELRGQQQKQEEQHEENIKEKKEQEQQQDQQHEH